MTDREIIVIKIGTSSITDTKVGVDYKTINLLAKAVSDLRAQGHTLVIVSSGAMSLGICKLGLSHNHSENLAYKQALTSVGQVSLMNAYENIFKYYGYNVGQVLITHSGLDDKERNDSIRGTFENIFKLGVIPVVNANDTVTSEELAYGDNDSLSARVAELLKAQKLVFITDAGGFYDKDPHLDSSAKLIERVSDIDDYIYSLAGESSSKVGLGGMKSKVEAAKICMGSKIKLLITGKKEISNLSELCNPDVKIKGTWFF